jgi:hypothetical protein
MCVSVCVCVFFFPLVVLGFKLRQMLYHLAPDLFELGFFQIGSHSLLRVIWTPSYLCFLPSWDDWHIG